MSRGFNFKEGRQATQGCQQTTPPTTPTKLTEPITFDQLPDSAWLRESQLVRSSKNTVSATAPLPFSAPTLWRLVRAGKFPKPTKLSERVTAWNAGAVREWLSTQAQG